MVVRAAAMSHAPSLLDLRGQRADEAREAVRQLVDDAYLAGLPEVEIVHGRGTGAVRSAVREELDRPPARGAPRERERRRRDARHAGDAFGLAGFNVRPPPHTDS